MKKIIIKNAYSHNLKNINIDIPRNNFIVITGPSGSGKSSLAFDTIYKEGQRRFLESLSSYGKTYLQSLDRPKVESIVGLSPSVAIDQRSAGTNPRSTVGTLTDIYDYLRTLYAHISIPHSPESGKPIKPQDKEKIIDFILGQKKDSKVVILSPILHHKKGEHRDVLARYESMGYQRIRVNGKIQYIDEPLKIKKNVFNNIDLVIDRIILKNDSSERVKSSVIHGLRFSKGSLICLVDEKEYFLSENYYCPVADKSYPKLDESIFSFNSPRGQCEYCLGLGTLIEVTENSLIYDKELSLAEGPLSAFMEKETVFTKYVEKFLKGIKLDLDTPITNYSKPQLSALLHGDKSFSGILSYLNNFLEEYNEEEYTLKNVVEFNNCSECHGKKLNPYALAATIFDYSISDLCDLSIEDFATVFTKIKTKYKDHPVVGRVLNEIDDRVHFLLEIGLNYLTLNRKASTLSGGEFQRIRLSAQLGSMMSGVVYILDEPSIGLHQRDNSRLINSLKKLRDLNNTVIVVEHDEETMRASDLIIDIGPGSGKEGGYVVAQGTLPEITKSKDSLTAQYLSGRQKIVVPAKRREQKNWLKLTKAKENNLQSVDVDLPLENFICLTGVSGSGKSTLIHRVLVPAIKHKLFRGYPKYNNFGSLSGTNQLDDLIKIDQSPIGRTPKSVPVTYCGIFNLIRNLFANTPKAKVLGMKAGHFSFNVKAGQCPECEGSGLIKFEMPFLSNVFNTCPACQGKRYNEEVLSIYYKGLNISDVLELTVKEAKEIFQNHNKIHYTLQTLSDVGLDYIRLGQPSPTLSGGEAQRIKLSRELSKIKKGHCLYILDEPTTGLHFNDINMLLQSLQKLIDAGNTVLVIEHNMDVIKTADYIIDLGPDGGKHGGEVVATGTPEQVIKSKKSITGKFLKEVLK